MTRTLVNTSKVLVALLAVLAAGLTLTSPVAAAATGRTGIATATAGDRPDQNRWVWTLGELHSGDCTMFAGATWTFADDGTAELRATVTSSDDHDAWVQWIDVYDTNGAFMGNIINRYPDTSDPKKFVKNMPDSSKQYAWFGYGNFDPNWYWSIGHVELRYSC